MAEFRGNPPPLLREGVENYPCWVGTPAEVQEVLQALGGGAVISGSEPEPEPEPTGPAGVNGEEYVGMWCGFHIFRSAHGGGFAWCVPDQDPSAN